MRQNADFVPARICNKKFINQQKQNQLWEFYKQQLLLVRLLRE